MNTTTVILFVRMWVEIFFGWNRWHDYRVILFVRMWVEMISQALTQAGYFVILFVRMWVEMYVSSGRFLYLAMSSSSWGCELKCHFSCIASPSLKSSSSWGCELKFKTSNNSTDKTCHPLREDVSWNVFHPFLYQFKSRHPLREDVSWNIFWMCKV